MTTRLTQEVSFQPEELYKAQEFRLEHPDFDVEITPRHVVIFRKYDEVEVKV